MKRVNERVHERENALDSVWRTDCCFLRIKGGLGIRRRSRGEGVDAKRCEGGLPSVLLLTTSVRLGFPI